MKNIEIRPCYNGDFNFYVSRTPYQVSIKLDGWIARIVWYIMYPFWKYGRHDTVSLKGEWEAIEFWKDKI